MKKRAEKGAPGTVFRVRSAGPPVRERTGTAGGGGFRQTMLAFSVKNGASGIPGRAAAHEKSAVPRARSGKKIGRGGRGGFPMHARQRTEEKPEKTGSGEKPENGRKSPEIGLRDIGSSHRFFSLKGGFSVRGGMRRGRKGVFRAVVCPSFFSLRGLFSAPTYSRRARS